ncbi:MAG TPA: 3-hydroxyacyl-CoA dehydrogenase NAD-binding domain-containing protein [Chloroflexia bacterium]|nr:3-hydroxyacyl-CoA dehydrogenase NAD-binding domain-containing protein [Chloroflexia bacterium]
MESESGRSENVISIGLGTMGPGLAVDYLLGGHHVTLVGRNPARLEAARQRVATTLDFLLQEEYLTLERRQSALACLATGLLSDDALLADATIIVESVAENLEVKQDFFAKLEPRCSPETLFLSNTSGLSVSAIFAHLQHPERALGTHYWNPPYLMPLVEVTPGQHTGKASLAKVLDLLEGMGKKPVLVRKELPGLIWNRLQFALFRECLHLLQEGVATAEEIDSVVEMGLARRASATGLFKVADLGGGDVWYDIASYLFSELSNAVEPPPVWTEMIERGEFGLKSGQGFYRWQPEQASAITAARDRYLLSKLKEQNQG